MSHDRKPFGPFNVSSLGHSPGAHFRAWPRAQELLTAQGVGAGIIYGPPQGGIAPMTALQAALLAAPLPVDLAAAMTVLRRLASRLTSHTHSSWHRLCGRLRTTCPPHVSEPTPCQ